MPKTGITQENTNLLVSENRDTDYCLCTTCSGSGEVSERVSAYDSETSKCKYCCGSGRLKVVTIKQYFRIGCEVKPEVKLKPTIEDEQIL
jgi:hypothetical protein